MEMSLDEKYLRRCLELASKGLGFVSPNPMVGCVIVRNGRVVSEGFHRRFGGPHAEIEALRKAGRKAKGASLYVNLEPCAHHGKTPPCVDAIVAAGIKTVIACSSDPNPLTSGRGFAALRKAGIRVRAGNLKKESGELNVRFFTFMKSRMPYVGVKIAQTLDGRSADHRFKSKWITSRAARKEAHRLRSLYDAILVGAKTVERDNPKLTVRHIKGRNPLRVVLDPSLRLNPAKAIFKTVAAGTLVFTSARAMATRKAKVETLRKCGVFIVGMDRSRPLNLRVILRTLGALGVSSVLVEGGPYTVGEFLSLRLVHKVHAFVAPRLLGGGLNSMKISPPLALVSSIDLREVSIRRLGPDILIEGLTWFQ